MCDTLSSLWRGRLRKSPGTTVDSDGDEPLLAISPGPLVPFIDSFNSPSLPSAAFSASNPAAAHFGGRTSSSPARLMRRRRSSLGLFPARQRRRSNSIRPIKRRPARLLAVHGRGSLPGVINAARRAVTGPMPSSVFSHLFIFPCRCLVAGSRRAQPRCEPGRGRSQRAPTSSSKLLLEKVGLFQSP